MTNGHEAEVTVFLGWWERRQREKRDATGYDENIQRKWVTKSRRYYRSKLT